MDKFPLLAGGRSAGELTVEQERLYTWFTARCALPEEGLWCAWAVGEGGELRLGVLEPEGGQGTIRRRFSHSLTDPVGRLLRGEVRPAAETAPWETERAPADLFRQPWLRRQLAGAERALVRREGGRLYLALPWDTGAPFPLPGLFCLAGVRRLRGGDWAVFAFDGEEMPVQF